MALENVYHTRECSVIMYAIDKYKTVFYLYCLYCPPNWLPMFNYKLFCDCSMISNIHRQIEENKGNSLSIAADVEVDTYTYMSKDLVGH